ncbi:hypothetical protein ANO14919_059300 [Xylariales sp. No.14919]|nr:hypothetical protein ANO14919_059300 [Xylariales sp. No.14919]
MEREPTVQTSPLYRVPLEVAMLILCESDCIKTLHCAIRSCRLLHDAFSSGPLLIANRVVAGQLSLGDAHPEAIALVRASQLPEITLKSLALFYKDHFRERNTESIIMSLTFDQAATVSRLHSVITRMTEDFARTRYQDPLAQEGRMVTLPTS